MNFRRKKKIVTRLIKEREKKRKYMTKGTICGKKVLIV
jgi:hypothetical protein